jgi:hypothetical protein
MANSDRMRILCNAVPVLFAACCASIAGGTRSSTPFQQFDHTTAWAYLGEVDENGSTWMTQVRHVNESRPAGVLPQVGEEIRFTADVRLYIGDYITDREAKRFVPPANRSLTPNDYTGAVLQSSRGQG